MKRSNNDGELKFVAERGTARKCRVTADECPSTERHIKIGKLLLVFNFSFLGYLLPLINNKQIRFQAK